MAELEQKEGSVLPASIQPAPIEIHKADGQPDKIRWQRFKQIKQLQGKGYSIRAMARHLGMHRQTDKNYLDMETLPRKSQGSGNIIEQYFLCQLLYV